jgi:hypothetical protein
MKFVRKKISEDAPANSVGGGNIAGLGVGLQGEPGISSSVMKRHKKRNENDEESRTTEVNLMRRKTPMAEETERTGDYKTGMFAGQTTFVVPSNIFHEARMSKRRGKHWRTYIGEEDHWRHIREYAAKYPKKSIILQDERTGAMCYARYGKNKNLMEAPLLDYIGKKRKFNRETGIKLSNPGERVSKIDKDHDLHHLTYPEGGSSYIVRNRKTGVGHMTIYGHRNRAGSFEINATDSTGEGPKAHKVYRKILQSGHAKALVGASHSEGGQKIWQKLSSEKNVSVHGWHKGKPVNLDPKDPEETHISSDELSKNLDKGDRKTYGTKLVASYVKRKTAK